jgi:lipoprotein-anchoring transpeptidase ErfK/SrfK
MLSRRSILAPSLSFLAAGLAGCGVERFGPPPTSRPRAGGRRLTRTLARPNYAAVYAAYPGERFFIPAVDHRAIDPRHLRQSVDYPWPDPPGSIVIDPASHHLYFVEAPRVATRYGVGVGREGFGWSGAARINMKRDWPDWVPPREMIEREPQIRAQLEQTPRGLGVRGGPKNPLGARTLYLFDQSGDTGYRVHGTLEPYTIGSNVSSGCIRMINQDIVHLYARVPIGTPVTVLGA